MVTRSPNGPTRTRWFNELGTDNTNRNQLFDDFLYQLKGVRAVKVYEEMSKNDPTIWSILFAIEHMAREVDWHVEPGDETPESEELAQFVDECRLDMSHTWDDFISAVFTQLVYGFSYFETVYKRRNGRSRKPISMFDDGRIGWRKQAYRPQNTLYKWEFDPAGGLAGMWQMAGSEKILIPIEKSLLFRTQNRGRPEGQSVLRGAYRPWWFKKRTEEIEGIGAERDLAGLPIAKVPIEILESSDSDSVKSAIKDIVTRTKRDEQEGILWPNERDDDGNPLYEFELLSTGGTRQFDTNAIIQRYDQAISRVVLADFIMLGHSAVGSRALADPKIGLFMTAMTAWMDSIEETLNRHAVPRLLDVNGIQTDQPPKIKHGELKEPDIGQIGAYIKDTAQGGMPWFPNVEIENKLREHLGLEPLDPEEQAEQQMPVLTPPQGEPPEGPQQVGGNVG